MKKRSAFAILALVVSVWAGPPKGKPIDPESGMKEKLQALQGKINGKICWSTSRNGNHDIYIMNADGTAKKALTKSSKTDWFSRFSPDGKTVIFTRSKPDWMVERNAKNYKAWDTWIINVDGTDEKKLIDNATWATWRPDGKVIVFARGTQVWKYNVATAQEKMIVDSQERQGAFKKAAILQNPHMSPNGKFLAITLRGPMRETGIYNIAKKSWFTAGVGAGCQINWFPNSKRVYRMNPTGNGHSEIIAFNVTEDGVAANPKASLKDMAFMDLPGRRSHEYFPQVSSDSKWLVWGATQRGHDHDLYDYEIYLWEIGTPQAEAIQMTHHTGNDRWPDIWLAP